jgi:drug/metabolite transporter (DMT)-like permease
MMTALWHSASPVMQGILLRVLSGVLFTGMIACVKGVSDTVPLGQIVFFRSFIALGPLVAFLWVTGAFPSGLRTRRPWGHALRACMGAAAMITSFAALARLSVAEATLLGYLAPLFVTILAVLLLGEHLTHSRIWGLILGFSGVFVLTAPDILGNGAELDARRSAGIGLAVLASVLTAGALLQIRRLTATENAGAIAFYFALVASLLGLATSPFGWVMPSGQGLVLLTMAGIFGGFAHIAMTLSFKLAEASALAPFEYLTLIWAVLTDLFLFHSPIGPAFLLALPLLLTGATVTGRGERRKATGLVP